MIEDEISELMELADDMPEFKECIRAYEKNIVSEVPNIKKLRRHFKFFWVMGYLAGVEHNKDD